MSSFKEFIDSLSDSLVLEKSSFSMKMFDAVNCLVFSSFKLVSVVSVHFLSIVMFSSVI